MNKLLILFSFCFVLSVNAQKSEEENIKNTIIEFFEVFHKQDTVALKKMAKGKVILQSISVNKEGKTIVSESSYNDFVKRIGSIPKESTFEEKLLSYSIQVDGNMANAWTPYEFWYNGKFSHCGVNSFQLVKEDETWKIIYLVDTRRRKNCN
ncbi:MAG: hypothetical protein Wins2KO_00920 [Winogradskyella sp.]